MSIGNLLLDRTGLSPVARGFVYDEIRSRSLRLASLLILSVIAAVIEITGVGLVFPVLLILVSPEYIDRSKLLAQSIDLIGLGRGFGLSVFLLCLIAVLMISKNIYMVFFSWLQARFLARWKTEISSRMMRMYIFSDYSLYLVKNSSEIIRNLALTTAVYDHFMTGMILVLVNGIVLLGLVSLLLVALPLEAAFGVALVLAASALVYRATSGTFQEIGKEQNVLFERRQSILRQAIGMVKETKIAAKERFFLDAFCAVERRNFLKQAHYNLLSIVPALVIEGAVIVAVLVLVAYIVFISPQPGAGVATLGLLAATLFRMMTPLNRILSSLQLISLGHDAVELFAKEFSEHERNAYVPEVEPDPLRFERNFGLANVTFSYPTGTSPAVEGVTLSIEKNETIGITGPSGSGKTTLAAMLMGLIPPTSGDLCVDGNPVTTREQLRAWHRHLGYVPQSVFVIEDTIARNIALAQDESELDEKRIWDVLDVVQLREFVESLPKKLHHFVGEEGARLSGGQRQRLGIARALYFDPNVLLLDEATSALDVAIERAFSDSLMRLKRTRSLIIIAHRLSTLRDCDRIVMLDKGRVLDVAPFEELERRCEPFRRLAKLSQLAPA
jgi:ATP-binding cassette, subfamily B, bacterial PglK